MMALGAEGPRSMQRSDLDRPREDLHLHDHAVCLFDSEADLSEALASFLRAGTRANELSVFVHSFPTDDLAWAFLAGAYAEGGPPRRDVILVSLYTDAFEGGSPSIDYAHVGRVVEGIRDFAAKGGHDGARIFVDASRRYLGGGRADEWFAFESWLGRRLDAEVGLVCAYLRQDAMDPEHIARILETHAYRFGA